MSGYDRPERADSAGSAEREYAKLRRSLLAARARGDRRAAAYLESRISRLRAERDRRGSW